MKLLAQKHTPEDISTLKQYICQIKLSDPEDTNALSQLLFEYHLCIGIRSGNNVIPMVMNAFHDISIIFWNTWLKKTGISEVIIFLTSYTDYIESGNSQAAMELYRKYADEFLGTLE